MGVLVDWPGEATHPQRFVFLASESKPPACVADVLAIEQAARRREELNALYVALTRTQHTLVISSLEPHTANGGSWWQRLHETAADAPLPPAIEPAPGMLKGGAPAFSLLSLPQLPQDLVLSTQASVEPAAFADATPAQSEPDSLDSRVGQAMHRLLEHYRPAADGEGAAPWGAGALRASVAQAFALEAAQVDVALAMARRIVQGEGAWAWDPAQLAWQGNEVPLVHRGRMLRLDRLVWRKPQGQLEGQWWVLDYKSTSQPQLQAELCEQLLNYRAAVAQAQPGQTVRAAFLTAEGTLIELHAP